MRRAEPRVCGPCAPLPARCAPAGGAAPEAPLRGVSPNPKLCGRRSRRVRETRARARRRCAAPRAGAERRAVIARPSAAAAARPGAAPGCAASARPERSPPRPCLPQPRSKPSPRAGTNRRSSVSIHLPVLKLQRGSGRRNPPWLGPARRPPPAAASVRARSGAQRSCRPDPARPPLPCRRARLAPCRGSTPGARVVLLLFPFFLSFISLLFFKFFFPPTGNAQSGLMDISELCISDPLGYHNQ